jgi:hypothetical protein
VRTNLNVYVFMAQYALLKEINLLTKM